MTTTWILVANASRANLYRRQGLHAALEPLEQLDHPASRATDTEFTNERPGHYQTDGGARGAFSQPTDPKQHEEDKFAAQLAHLLETGRTDHRFEHLILVAPAPFMGKLHHHLDKHVSALVSASLEKDYTHCTERELVSQLEAAW